MKRIASFGFGGRGSGFIESYRQLGMYGRDVEWAGAYDVDLDSARASCRRVGVDIPLFDSPAELLRQTSPDAVIIASYDNAHLDNFEAVAALDIPVMIEKPLEATPTRARRLAALAASRPAPVLVAHNMRFAPILQRGRDLLRQGAIGRINSFRFENNVHYGHVYFRKWMRLRKNVGDVLVEKGAHDLDILHMLTGARTTSIYARSRRFEYGGDRADDLRCRACAERTTCRDGIERFLFEVEGMTAQEAAKQAPPDLCVYAREIDVTDDNVCIIELDSGAHGTYVQTLYTPRSYKSRIYTLVGSLGMMEIDLGEFSGEIRLYPRYGSKRDATTQIFDYHQRNHYNADHHLVRHFYDVITGRARPQCTAADGLAAVETAAAAMRSADSGQRVVLRSPESPAIVQDMVSGNAAATPRSATQASV